MNSLLEILEIEDLLSSKLNKYWYIIYVRKSTNEDWKQIQSLEDQLKSCYDYAIKKWIKLAHRNELANSFHDENIELEVKNFLEPNKEIYEKYFVIIEKWSAKIANNRPKWKSLIKLIKRWKIFWIISYHPDRQARNLSEAWEIIDLYDKWLVDLKYSTFDLDDTPSGKMILWMLFVISKHFSDKLSLDVKRWIIWNILKWKIKWNWKLYWYIRDKNGYIETDPIYWPLIAKAFEMKLEWKKEKDIIDFLNKHDFKVREKTENGEIIEKWKVKITANILSAIFKSPIYAWMIDFEEWKEKKRFHIYKDPELDFPILISKDLYYKVNNLKRKNRNIDLDLDISPFPRHFFKDINWYSLPFSIRSSSKKKYLEKENNIKPEDFFKRPDFSFRLQAKSKNNNWISIYDTRKKLGKKVSFQLAHIEDNIIFQAFKKINIEKANIIFIKQSNVILNKYLLEFSKENTKLIWSLNRFKSLLKNEENRKKQTLQEYKNDKKELDDKIKVHNIKIEKYRININNLQEEWYILSKRINKIIDIITNLEYNLSHLEEYYMSLNYEWQRTIIKILFDKLIIDEYWFKLYCKKHLQPIFKTKSDLIINTELDKIK